jgi:hypothetical protein
MARGKADGVGGVACVELGRMVGFASHVFGEPEKLRDELDQLLDDDDERWYAFGFSKPSDPETPEVPENVVVTPSAAGMLFVDWGDARRGTSYRVIVMSNPGNVELKNEIVHDESDATLTGLSPGSVKVTVSSRNSKAAKALRAPR